jgi:guanine deaminase
MRQEQQNNARERIVKGTIVTFTDHYLANDALQHIEDGSVVLDTNGKIAWVGASDDLPTRYSGYDIDDYGDKLIMAGFVDTHIHFPQYRMLAASSNGLLDWLDRYTFPEELKYSSDSYAEAAAQKFLEALFRNGTTSALAFSTVHSSSVNALFQAAQEKNMALVTGKTMMDRNAPQELTDNAQSSYEECQQLIDKWHGKDRLHYAITPRFAITSTGAQLRYAGNLLQDNKTCLMQTHLSESLGELAAVEDLFPNARDYTDVYDAFDLVTDRSIFAHGIHLSERELARLSEAGSSIIHCPTSNTFLGSGLFKIAAMKDKSRPIKMGMATDIGAGTSFSMLATMAEAFKVGMLNGYRLSAQEAFYTATLGNAEVLKLSSDIGSIENGKWADLIVLDPKATDVLANRMQLSDSIEDVLFSLMLLGDDRAIQATYVAGALAHKNGH